MLWHAQGVDIDQAMLALSTYVGHVNVTNTYWYLSAVPGADRAGRRTLRIVDAPVGGVECVTPPDRGAVVRCARPAVLCRVPRRAARAQPRTVACYRDAMMLFLGFAGRRLGKGPSALRLVDIRPDLILAFLDHLERERHNAVRSRNLRLTALRAFLKFAAAVTCVAARRRAALGVPMKRSTTDARLPHAREEMLAVLGQPGSALDLAARPSIARDALQHRSAGIGDHRRARVDVVLDGAACVHLHGKGRKQRSVPLWKSTVQEIRARLRINPRLRDEAALLPNRDGLAIRAATRPAA